MADPRTNLAHIRADHSVDPNFNPYVNDAVNTLAVSGSTLYAAGQFTSIGGQPRTYIAALDRADGSVKAFNPNANAGIRALAISSDGAIIYAGGSFTVIGGQPRISIAALNAGGPLDGTATLTFNPSATGTLGSGVVDALAISGSTLMWGVLSTPSAANPAQHRSAQSRNSPRRRRRPRLQSSPSRVDAQPAGASPRWGSSDGATVYAVGPSTSSAPNRATTSLASTPRMAWHPF